MGLRLGKLRLGKASSLTRSHQSQDLGLLPGVLVHCSRLTPVLTFVFLIPERRGSVYHGLKSVLFLRFPIIDSNSSYRRPAQGKHVLLSQPSTSSRRLGGGGPRPQGKRGVTFPLVFFFFHLTVGGQQNMFSFFSKGNWEKISKKLWIVILLVNSNYFSQFSKF